MLQSDNELWIVRTNVRDVVFLGRRSKQIDKTNVDG